MLTLPNKVTIIEVGPRDGLQNEKNFVPTEIKKQFIAGLRSAGLEEMELTSFVSPKAGSADGDAAEIVADCLEPNTRNFAAPNRKGIDRIYMSECEAVAVFVGVSNSFNLKNINKTTRDSMAELKPIISELRQKGYFVRACISTAFYCPYEGKKTENDTIQLCREFVEAGVDELSVADTIGMASPSEAYSLFITLKRNFPIRC